MTQVEMNAWTVQINRSEALLVDYLLRIKHLKKEIKKKYEDCLDELKYQLEAIRGKKRNFILVSSSVWVLFKTDFEKILIKFIADILAFGRSLKEIGEN